MTFFLRLYCQWISHAIHLQGKFLEAILTEQNKFWAPSSMHNKNPQVTDCICSERERDRQEGVPFSGGTKTDGKEGSDDAPSDSSSWTEYLPLFASLLLLYIVNERDIETADGGEYKKRKKRWITNSLTHQLWTMSHPWSEKDQDRSQERECGWRR